MPECREMKKGDVYYCKDCGVEITVTKECVGCGKPSIACECGPCSFVCCNQEVQLKEGKKR
jgi:hypothetical protein